MVWIVEVRAFLMFFLIIVGLIWVNVATFITFSTIFSFLSFSPFSPIFGPIQYFPLLSSIFQLAGLVP